MKKFRAWLLRFVAPVVIWIGKMAWPFTRKLITGGDYREFAALVKPGMVFLTRTRGEWNNSLIPGFWTHSAIVATETSVIESTSHGVVETDLVEFLMKKDFVCLLRPTFASDAQMLLAAQIARTAIGKPYDYYFETGFDSFYCSELVTWALEKALLPKPSPFTKRRTLGVETVTPQDIFDASTKFDIVHCSRIGEGVPSWMQKSISAT